MSRKATELRVRHEKTVHPPFTLSLSKGAPVMVRQAFPEPSRRACPEPSRRARNQATGVSIALSNLSSVLLLAVMLCLAAPASAQQAPAAVTPTRQAFQSLELGMTREQVSKLVSSQGPMDLKQEIWGRWVPGAKTGEMEVLRVHFFDNRAYWIEYDAFGESWWREEKGGCSEWIRVPIRRLKDIFDVK